MFSDPVQLGIVSAEMLDALVNLYVSTRRLVLILGTLTTCGPSFTTSIAVYIAWGSSVSIRHFSPRPSRPSQPVSRGTRPSAPKLSRITLTCWPTSLFVG